MRTFKKIFYLLTKKDQRNTFLLFILILIMAFLEMLGVVSIMPFIAVLSNPEIIETNLFLNKIYNFVSKYGIDTNFKFLFFLGVFFGAFLIISIIFKAYTNYFQLKFTAMCQYRISKKLVDKYLSQKYSWYLDRNSADLAKNILSEVGVIVSKGIRPLINLVTYSLVTLILIIMLAIVNVKLSLIISLLFGSVYFIIFRYVKIFLNKIGKQRLRSNKLRFYLVNQAFGAFKDIKISNLEKVFLNEYSLQAKIFAKNESLGQIISQLPRYFLEAFAFGAILLFLLLFMRLTNNIVDVLPMLTLYILAGYRLVPALQLIYNSISQLRLVTPSLDVLYNDMTTLETLKLDSGKNFLQFNKSITLSNVSFKYPYSSKLILDNININIPIKSKVAIVGSTGGGKTTLVDIILGLLELEHGILAVDGNTIDINNIRSWQSNIGYVQQNIFLIDDTISANIAFGVENENINYQKVEEVAKISNLDNFIKNELPLQYQTIVGERGVKLSGGQKQRIGIARALYRNPKVLVLDEATSALDILTEKKIMEEVFNLDKELTILIIAHRLSSLKKCDKIIYLENGTLKYEGNFQEISQKIKLFKE